MNKMLAKVGNFVKSAKFHAYMLGASALALPCTSLAEGSSSTDITTSGDASAVAGAIADSFKSWITATQDKIGVLLGAGVAIVAIFFIWRVLKKALLGSK